MRCLFENSDLAESYQCLVAPNEPTVNRKELEKSTIPLSTYLTS